MPLFSIPKGLMPATPRPNRRFRSLRVETLESRQLLSSTPWGATTLDTAEYLLGDVGVTLVLMESEGAASSEDWTDASIEAVKVKVAEGLQWWEDTLAQESSVHSLNFVLDTTHADTPVETSIEPIANYSNRYTTWVNDFLLDVEADITGVLSTDIRQFNDSQRQALSTHWAFTIFVVNNENDLLNDDGKFAIGGSFSQAFAFPGGQFYVAPASRPAATFAHELGHIFWARDEYSGAGSYTDRRGYYNAQNWNAANNPTNGFEQVDSIMASGTLMENAYAQHVSSPSSLEMLGWRDTDQDGVFDVLDVPHSLQGAGYLDSATGHYRFVGSASVQSLPNLNFSGQQNDIVLSQVDVVEYRLDGGDWQVLQTPSLYSVELDLSIPVGTAVQEVEVRTRSQDPGTEMTITTSDVFWGRTDLVTTTAAPGIRGVVWYDISADGQWDPGETGFSGWQVQLVDSSGEPIELASYLEPDTFTDNDILNEENAAVTLSLDGYDVGSLSVFSRVSQQTSSGSRVFANQSWSQAAITTDWEAGKRELRMDFTQPVTYVSLDAVANSDGDYGRLEIYDTAGQLLGRYTTDALDVGQTESMVLATPTAEISYAIAAGHMHSTIQLDRLQVGPNSTVTTNDQGAYWLPWLPPAEYHVKAALPSNWSATTPENGVQTVVLAASQEIGRIDFGQKPPPGPAWQNPLAHNDVNNDGNVTPLDALYIINALNANGGGALPDPPAEGEGPPPYPDVSGDGYLTPLDALSIINVLNQACCSGNGEGESSGNNSPAKGATAPEGEADSVRAEAWKEYGALPLVALPNGLEMVWQSNKTVISVDPPADQLTRQDSNPILPGLVEPLGQEGPLSQPRMKPGISVSRDGDENRPRQRAEQPAVASDDWSLDAVFRDLGCRL